MTIKIIQEPISIEELRRIAENQFGTFVKAAVDVEKAIMAIGGELHADEEVLLTEKEGSRRKDIWGINIYPEKSEDDWVEFDSMINIKPQFGNYSRGVGDTIVREKIKSIVNKLIKR